MENRNVETKTRVKAGAIGTEELSIGDFGLVDHRDERALGDAGEHSFGRGKGRGC